MASTSNLRGTHLAVGQASKEETINAVSDLFDSAIAGKRDVTLTTADVTLSGTPANPEAQNKFFNLSGTLTGNRSLIFPVNDDEPATGNPRTIYVKNGTAGAFSVTVKVSGQTGVTVSQGYTAILLHNGTDFVKLFEVSSASGISLSGGAWASWTPTWTNASVGDGTVTAKYSQIGKTVFCRLTFVLGSTSSVGTSVSFSLPVTAATYPSAFMPIGEAHFLDASVPALFKGAVLWSSTTTAALNVENASGTYTSLAALTNLIPFTWTTSDAIECQFHYEAA